MSEPTYGLASFHERSEQERGGLARVWAFLENRPYTVGIEAADIETQKRDDIDIILYESNPKEGSTKAVTFEVKVDSRIHETGNMVFETISNEMKATSGCLMRTRADYIIYFASQTGDAWVFRADKAREWFIDEMTTRSKMARRGNSYAGRFKLAETFSIRSDDPSRVFSTVLRLVPVVELVNGLAARGVQVFRYNIPPLNPDEGS